MGGGAPHAGEFGGVVPPGEQSPILRVVRGDATAEEIAALVAALTVAAAARGGVAGGQAGRTAVRNEWNEKARLMRPALHPSAGGWRRSALPH